MCAKSPPLFFCSSQHSPPPPPIHTLLVSFPINLGLVIVERSRVWIDRSDFRGGHVITSGGALNVNDCPSVNITGSVFESNTALIGMLGR